MTKQTYVKVGGVWKPCTSIWTKAGGVWKQDVMPFARVGGVFKECMNYVPPEGVWEEAILTIGYNDFGGGDECYGWSQDPRFPPGWGGLNPLIGQQNGLNMFHWNPWNGGILETVFSKSSTYHLIIDGIDYGIHESWGFPLSTNPFPVIGGTHNIALKLL